MFVVTTLSRACVIVCSLAILVYHTIMDHCFRKPVPKLGPKHPSTTHSWGSASGIAAPLSLSSTFLHS